ncbi:hypothetical protein EDD85DRAFT_3377 [Armillaria nabsnona]|nr:hypothetical protein EDD85DRAFT_3377 [Armillaria nabsnona]
MTVQKGPILVAAFTNPNCTPTRTLRSQLLNYASTNPRHRQPLGSLAQTIDVRDSPGARMARCQRDVMHRAHILISYETLCVYKPRTFATIAPSHFHIPAGLKRRRRGIRCRDADVVVFCCGEKCVQLGDHPVEGSYLSQTTSISSHFTYCHIQPTNPESRDALSWSSQDSVRRRHLRNLLLSHPFECTDVPIVIARACALPTVVVGCLDPKYFSN